MTMVGRRSARDSAWSFLCTADLNGGALNFATYELEGALKRLTRDKG